MQTIRRSPQLSDWWLSGAQELGMGRVTVITGSPAWFPVDGRRSGLRASVEHEGSRSSHLVVGVAALVGCGGSDDSGASQAEIQQAREQGAAKARQQAKLRRLERQVQQIKKGQKKPPTTAGGTQSSGTSAGSSSCGDDLSVGPATTCGFGTNVRSDYYNEIGAGAGTVISYSPTTGQTYTMSCSAGAPHVCTGGNNAAVYFP